MAALQLITNPFHLDERPSLIHLQARRLSAADPLLTYSGAVSLQEVDGGIAPWRIPFADRRLYFPDGGMGRAAMPSGVRLSFVTDATWVRCMYAARPAPDMGAPAPVVGQIDVLVDGDMVASIPLETDLTVREFLIENLPDGEKSVALWLPGLNQVVLHGVEVPADANVRPDPVSAPKWVHYGSSESGWGASSPSQTWPALVARSLGLDLTSLAMGAGCHLQPMYGMLMRDLPADLLTCCVGINIYGARSLNEYTYQANLIGLVRSVREKHPVTPFVIMSYYHAPWHDAGETPGVFSLKQLREHTRQAVERLREHGDENLFYLHGPNVVGPESGHLYLEPPGQDQIHLNPEGHEVMADAFRHNLLQLVPALEPSRVPEGVRL